MLLNLTAAVLIRQQSVLNLLFGLAGRGSRTWPPGAMEHLQGAPRRRDPRRRRARRYGRAVRVRRRRDVARLRDGAPVTVTTLVLSYCLVVLAGIVVVGAAPAVRSRAHNVFELSHRFAGWRRDPAVLGPRCPPCAAASAETPAAAEALASSWHVRVLALLTASVASPWLRLRRAPRRVERLSSHAAVVHLDDGVTPAFALSGRDQPQPAARVARLCDGDDARAGGDTGCLCLPGR